MVVLCVNSKISQCSTTIRLLRSRPWEARNFKKEKWIQQNHKYPADPPTDKTFKLYEILDNINHYLYQIWEDFGLCVVQGLTSLTSHCYGFSQLSRSLWLQEVRSHRFLKRQETVRSRADGGRAHKTPVVFPFIERMWRQECFATNRQHR